MAKTTSSKEAKTATKAAAPAKAKVQKAETTTAKNDQASKIDNVLIVPESVSPAKVEDKSDSVLNSATVAAAVAQKSDSDTKNDTNNSDLAVNDDNIAVMAYFLWEQEGYIHGRDGEYWFRAEELLRNQLATKLSKH